MRRPILILIAGGLLAVLPGCGGDSPPEATSSIDPEAAAPPPPPPAARGPADASAKPVGEPKAGVGRRYPSFPDAVTGPPGWTDARSPFDVAAFLEAPPEEENAAPLYLDAIFEFSADVAVLFSPEERARREPLARRREQEFRPLNEARRKDPASVDPAAVDAWLAQLDTGFSKLALAQQRPRCVFQTGFGFASLLPHVQGARQVARAVTWRNGRDLARGDFDRAIRGVETLLRLSRDLRPRGVTVCQLVSAAMDGMCCSQIVPAILTTGGLQPEHCDRLLAALAGHEAEAIDPFLESQRGEYLIARKMLHDLQHRSGIFDPRYLKEELKVRGPVDSPIACIQVFQAIGGSGGSLARAKWGRLSDSRNPAEANGNRERLEQRLGSMTPEDYTNEADALNRVYASILGMTDRTSLQRSRACADPSLVEPLRETSVAVFLEPMTAPLLQAFMRTEAARRGTKCLIALRRWQLKHPGPPGDLETLLRAARIDRVPIDPYCDQPLRMALVEGEPVIYSVGKDGQDDRARSDWQGGTQPGDFIFRIAPPSR